MMTAKNAALTTKPTFSLVLPARTDSEPSKEAAARSTSVLNVQSKTMSKCAMIASIISTLVITAKCVFPVAVTLSITVWNAMTKEPSVWNVPGISCLLPPHQTKAYEEYL